MTSLTLVRRIAARPSIVFDALTTPEQVMAWWGPHDRPVLLAEMDARTGGAFRVRFCTEDGLEHEACGEFLAFERPERLAMSWRWGFGGVEDEAGRISRVDIALRPLEAGTELTLTHSRLNTEASRESHAEGWAGSLDKLERLLGDAS